MKICGFDLSINSTGVCLLDTEKNKKKYIIITSHNTGPYRKTRGLLLEGKSDIQIRIYDKEDTKGMGYSDKEQSKTNNIFNICNELKMIVKTFKPDLVQIEGIAYGATSGASVIDLSGLNFMVRMVLEECNVPFRIISPTENKKFATGNGAAKKDLMIYTWLQCEPDIKKLTEGFPKSVTIDDIADAYFLAHFSPENI